MKPHIKNFLYVVIASVHFLFDLIDNKIWWIKKKHFFRSKNFIAMYSLKYITKMLQCLSTKVRFMTKSNCRYNMNRQTTLILDTLYFSRVAKLLNHYSDCSEWVSEWVLLSPSSTICQQYHDENKLIFNEMMMRFTLY